MRTSPLPAKPELILALPEVKPPQMGKPLIGSLGAHSLLILLIPTVIDMAPLKPLEPIKVLEIGVIGPQDMALKGTAQDFNVGPLKESVGESLPVKGSGVVAAGNTPKVSKAIARSKAAPKAAAPIVLTAKGALFGSNTGGVAGGIGREKIHMAASPMRALASPGGDSDPNEKVEGLVGVSGEKIDLNAQRGTGGRGDGTGEFLGSGKGHVNGGMHLRRRGEPIMVDRPALSKDLIMARNAPAELPAPPSDDFFSISGPLGRRKIVKMRLPSYPRWAEESGLEAQVAVRLTVTSSGKVKPGNLSVEMTSGYPDIDRLVMESLRAMLFVPLDTQDGLREEWGVATFNFKLRKGSQGG